MYVCMYMHTSKCLSVCLSIYRTRICLPIHLSMWLSWAKISNYLSPEPTKELQDKELPYAIIVGVSSGGLFVVVLCIIFFVRFCKNRNAAHRRKRASDIMPPEKAFPNPEKYELKSVALNNAYVSVGEISLGCDKQATGFSNEGFHWY